MTLDSGCLPAHLATTTASRDEPVQQDRMMVQKKREEFVQRAAEVVRVSMKALVAPSARDLAKPALTRKKTSTNLTRKTAGTDTTHKL